MRFICLGYCDHTKFESMREVELKRIMDECFDYDDVLREGGHFVGGEALGFASTSVTLRPRGDRVEATDGPYAETKEQLGGILILEAQDMDEAVELMSRHPGTRLGPFEIRPADEQTNAMVEQRSRRFVESRR